MHTKPRHHNNVDQQEDLDEYPEHLLPKDYLSDDFFLDKNTSFGLQYPRTIMPTQ
jgi:hypothetical protein